MIFEWLWGIMLVFDKLFSGISEKLVVLVLYMVKKLDSHFEKSYLIRKMPLSKQATISVIRGKHEISLIEL